MLEEGNKQNPDEQQCSSGFVRVEYGSGRQKTNPDELVELVWCKQVEVDDLEMVRGQTSDCSSSGLK